MFCAGEFMQSAVRALCKRAPSVCLAIFACHLVAAAAPVERIGSLSNPAASDELKKAVEDKGYRVTLDEAWTAELWFARTLPTPSKDSPGALYPELTNGQFIAVVNFVKGFSDSRGQPIPPGLYTLRYQYLPQDANHMGVSPNPDFLLAIPLADDPNPAATLPFKRLVALSVKSTGTAHPAVVAMAAAGVPATVSKDDQGMTIVTVEVTTSPSSKTEKLGIILKGQATQ
jgi:hypothetical protein